MQNSRQSPCNRGSTSVRPKKAIIAAAGFGTRFLPATKVVPKELLPLIDKPIIQYLVEEAVASGIEEVILVTRPGAKQIQEHFSGKIAVEEHLIKQGKTELLESLKKIGQMAKFTFIEQDPSLPYGTGAPLVSAKDQISKDEFFVLMFGDDLVKAEIPASKQLLDLWGKEQTVLLGCQEVAPSEVSKYGIVQLKEGTMEVENFIEKPKVEEAPSRLASFGRFILNRQILDMLLERKDNVPEGKEFYLTDTLLAYAQKNRTLAAKIDGLWLTTGDPVNWLRATLEYAKDREELSSELSRLRLQLRLQGQALEP